MKLPTALSLAAMTAMTVLASMGAGPASATTLEVGTVTQGKSVSLTMSLAASSSLVYKDKNGITMETCTGSELKGATEGIFTGRDVGGKVSSLSFSGCSHTTHVLKPGSLAFTWTSGTNAAVSSSGAEWTLRSTAFGASAVCATGSGTVIGTLTGVSSGHATMHINATALNCGIMGISSWMGTYRVTSPTSLGVES